jgi:metal transporter CNNM
MDKQEVDVVVGALQLKTKVVMDVYTPIRHVYAVPDDLVLDRGGMTEIYAAGYSRVRVYHRLPKLNTNDKDNDDDVKDDEDYNRWCVSGFLMTRQLMMINWDHERDISTLALMRPDAVRPRMNLVKLLGLLRDGGSHMAFVCARPDLANRALQQELPTPPEAGFMGIVTLEDIMESILQNRIYDELDIRDRDRAVVTLTRWAAEKLQSFAKKKVLQRKQQQQQQQQQRIRSTQSDIRVII